MTAALDTAPVAALRAALTDLDATLAAWPAPRRLADVVFVLLIRIVVHRLERRVTEQEAAESPQ